MLKEIEIGLLLSGIEFLMELDRSCSVIFPLGSDVLASKLSHFVRKRVLFNEGWYLIVIKSRMRILSNFN